VTAIGRPLLLPAGEVSVTLDGGYSFTGIDSEDTRNPGLQTSLDRGDLSAGSTSRSRSPAGAKTTGRRSATSASTSRPGSTSCRTSAR
jgi:hypothetical protein